jgi:hypothetical protein
MIHRHIRQFDTFINERQNIQPIFEELTQTQIKHFLGIDDFVRDKRLKTLWDGLSETCDFKNDTGDRLYFKPTSPSSKDEIFFFLNDFNYKIEDYENNKVYDVKNKRSGMKLTAALSKIANQYKREDALSYLKKYNDEAARGKENRALEIDKYMIVLSKNKLDIARMSDDREWSSCMELVSGRFNEFVSEDIYEGTIVSYLINPDDLEINAPLARTLIKPYQEKGKPQNIYFFTEGKVYGKNVSGFLESVDSIIDNVQIIERPVSLSLIRTLYCDNIYRQKRLAGVQKLESDGEYNEEFIKLFTDTYNIYEYTINDDLSIDVDGDVLLSEVPFKKIPIKFNRVSGSFILSAGNINTLENCPKYVGKSFNCSNNRNLKRLQYSPEYVGKDFIASDCNIKDLKDISKDINGDVVLSNNKIETLEGLNEYVGGNLNVNNNQLKTLKGAPIKVQGSFDCSGNQLESLEYGPINVEESYYCYNNQLKTLKGAPKKIRSFNCSNNKIESLEYAPEVVEFSFFCDSNNLKSLKGSLKKVGEQASFRDNPDIEQKHVEEVKNEIKSFEILIDKENTLQELFK